MTASWTAALRHVFDLAGINGVTPHMFRRTVATVINDQAGVELAAELLGHTDPKITIQHDIRAFAAPPGEQAIRRRDLYRLQFTSGAIAHVGVPDELGALVAKGAAWLVDSRDRRRHLDDSAVLLACVLDASELDYESKSKNNRKFIRAVTDDLLDSAHVSWVNVDPADRERGMVNLRLIRQVLGFSD